MPSEQTFSSGSINDLDTVARSIIEYALGNQIWLFLGEIPPMSVFIGGCIIIVAVILKTLEKKHSNASQSI
jgi:drug/metabolite transporter (DMT)-like permease